MLTLLSSYLRSRVCISDVSLKHNAAGIRISWLSNYLHHYRNQPDRVHQPEKKVKRSSRSGGAWARGWLVEVPFFLRNSGKYLLALSLRPRGCVRNYTYWRWYLLVLSTSVNLKSPWKRHSSIVIHELGPCEMTGYEDKACSALCHPIVWSSSKRPAYRVRFCPLSCQHHPFYYDILRVRSNLW